MPAANEPETSSVELWVYDLSGGLARQLSASMLGTQLDAVYHTSVVVYGKEYFYGQGIAVTDPGMSHHGAPLERLDMGTTEIDAETFDELLSVLEEQYTAESYHLLRHNCNHFSDEVVTLLTGEQRVPTDILALPDTFLSTPMGRLMGGHIDALFPTAAATSAAAATPSVEGSGSAQQVLANEKDAAATETQHPSPAQTIALETVVNHVAHEAYTHSSGSGGKRSTDRAQPVPDPSVPEEDEPQRPQRH